MWFTSLSKSAQQVFSQHHDSPWCAGALLSILLLLPFSLTAQQMHWPHHSDGFNLANNYVTYSWRKPYLNFTCEKQTVIHWKQKYCFSFSDLVHQASHPSSSSSSSIITKDTWNDGQEHSTSAEADRSAVKWLYWPPHLTCLDSLRQSTPATSCPVQVRNIATRDKDNDSHRDKKENQTLLPWPKHITKWKLIENTIQPIVTYWYKSFHTHHCHNIHASM